MSDRRLSNKVTIGNDKLLQDGEFCAVEKILQMRATGGRTEFLVKWKDNSRKRSSWALQDDLNCPEIVEEFLQSQKRRSLTTRSMNLLQSAGSGKEDKCGSIDVVKKPIVVKLKKRTARLRAHKREDIGYKIMGPSEIKKIIRVHREEDRIEFEIELRNGCVFKVPKDYAYDKYRRAILGYYESIVDWEAISAKKGV